MNITKTIYLKGFKNKKSNKRIIKIFKKLIEEKNEIIKSLTKTYKNSYTNKFLTKYKKYSEIRLIGMGGSSLGAQSIYSFLKHKIKKKFIFVDNLDPENLNRKDNKKILNLVISKSGKTLETITNFNLLVRKEQKNIFITEDKKNTLRDLAKKLKSDVIFHNNFIGGRYSVLSEVGMLPADLMGLKPLKFKQLNSLVKKKNFIDILISNVSNLLTFANTKKTNSIILNYDDKSLDLFYWYQQLVAESIGKNSKGILPIISSMPKDNHSLMQLYLSGPKNNFYTFFFVKDKISKNINKVKFSQFNATQNVFKKKNIPFRSFVIDKRNEETLGELFTFFILETILLARAMNVNPFNQPAVELIKTETKKILSKS